MRKRIEYRGDWIRCSYIFHDVTIVYDVFYYHDESYMVYVTIDDTILSHLDFDDIMYNETFDIIKEESGFQHYAIYEYEKKFKAHLHKYGSFINGKIKNEIRMLIVVRWMI